jgi:cation diffusion facilitator family transporter
MARNPFLGGAIMYDGFVMQEERKEQERCCVLEHEYISETARRHEKNTRLVIVLTLVTMVAEISAGLAFGSMALLADGWHMASHAGALGITAAAYAVARRQARNPRFTFGTGKVGTLGGYTSAVVLMVVALLMALESVNRLISPVNISFDMAILVACLGLIVNLASAYLLGHHGHGHEHGEEEHGHDLNIRAAYLHVIADALTSILAIAALLLGKYFGWVSLDPVMGLVGAAIIGKWAYGLIKESGKILLDHTGGIGMTEMVRSSVEGPGDCTIRDLHVWRMGTKDYAAIISLVSAAPRSPDDYKRRLAGVPDLAHVTVEVVRSGESA